MTIQVERVRSSVLPKLPHLTSHNSFLAQPRTPATGTHTKCKLSVSPQRGTLVIRNTGLCNLYSVLGQQTRVTCSKDVAPSSSTSVWSMTCLDDPKRCRSHVRARYSLSRSGSAKQADLKPCNINILSRAMYHGHVKTLA